MAWKYYRKGKLVKECDNIPETMEDGVIELQENGVDVSDCVINDFWSPDYPSEEDEYKERKHYGIGYLDGGDLGTDAEGFDGFEISKKIIDNDWEFKTTDVEWEEIKE